MTRKRKRNDVPPPPPAADEVDWTKAELPEAMRANADWVFPEHLTLDPEMTAARGETTYSSQPPPFAEEIERLEEWANATAGNDSVGDELQVVAYRVLRELSFLRRDPPMPEPREAAFRLGQLAERRRILESWILHNWHTVTDVAELWGCHPQTVTRLCNSGKLRSNGRTGKHRRVDPGMCPKNEPLN